MIVSAFNGTRRARGMLSSCIGTGSYGLRGCAYSVSSVLDIGGNVGMFSIAARVLCPNAVVVALEPDPATFCDLMVNSKNMMIEPVRAAIGTGEDVRLYSAPRSERGCYGTRYDTCGNRGTAVRSVRLADVVKRFGLEAGLFLKIDCEGGEHHLIGDKEAEQVLRSAVGIGGEIHPVPNNRANQLFVNWITGLLAPTHNVKIVRNCPDGRGICEFNAVAKKLKPAPVVVERTRRVRFTREIKQVPRPGEPRRIQKDTVLEVSRERAAQWVCCGYCDYEL